MLDCTIDAAIDGATPPVGVAEALRAAYSTLAAQRSIRTHSLQMLRARIVERPNESRSVDSDPPDIIRTEMQLDEVLT